MPTLEEMAATPRSGLSLEQMTTTAKRPEVSQFDSFDDQQKAHIRNALLYSGMSNRLPGEVYDYTSSINQQIHGSPDEVMAWKKNIGIIKETKSWGQAVEHGLALMGKQTNKAMKDAGWMVADLDQQFWNWVEVKQPEILKRWDEEAFLFKRILDAELEMFYRDNPDKLPETAPETGYLQKALWYSENPKVVLQHAIQSAPIMLLGGVGKVAGLGKMGMIALFGGPTVAETYTEARGEGTDITPALAQALLTGGGEGAIEEWTFGRKIGIAQNFSKIVKSGFPKIAWEALKAYGRGTAEEAGQQANRNFWRFIFTDANQKISEGVADAAAAGGPVELLMAGVFGMGGYTINKGAELVDQAKQHRRLNIIDGEIQKSQNFTEAQKAEISQEIDSVREDVDSGVYLPEEEAEAPAQAVGKAPSVPAAGQPAETRAVEAAKAGPGAEAITKEALEEEETPEEAKSAEAKLEVEAAEEIEPELYIGNVTPGMKTRIAEGQGVKAEDVKGFTKEGFPTKRTKIKMTRGEAEQYLQWLENDLQERLDQNKINTRNQMAWANADWGDIKNLRTILGQEVGNRPFTIFYDQQHEIIEIKPTGKRIKGAVTPSALQESKMTVQEVLRAVMKRSARYAKMAYAKGRTELRAALRAKARARARLKKARETIKTPAPRTVDILHREAIEAIRKSIDPWFSRKKEAQFEVVEKEGKITGARRVLAIDQYLKQHPEFAEYIPIETIRRLKTKSYQEYTIEELEQISTAIEILKDMGGLRRKMEISQYETGKQKDLGELKKSSVPITDREMIKPEKIGETLSFKDRAKNMLSRALNWAAQKKRSIAEPMDVFFDLLDGVKEYAGANYRIFKEAVDVRWSKYLNTRDEILTPVIKLANELGLKEGNYERIGVHAALQQEGGRQKLLDSGFTEAQIDEVKLAADEMQLYNFMREQLDEMTPAIEDVMNNVYNEPLRKVKNYFSFMTDFESMSEYEIREMYGDRVLEFSSGLRKNVEKGFTITRMRGKQRIKINAMEIFSQHIDNASYLIEMGSEIKRLGEIAATKEYGEMVGERGQEEVRSWIDLMARKGRAQKNKTIPILDVFRKHTGAAIIGFKLSSALVNATPLLDGAGLIGRYAFQGTSEIATNRNWRQFLMKNFSELRDRVGGDIEFMEFGATVIEKIEKIGFWPLQKIDGLAASSITAGAYQKYLDEHGLEMDFENPNADAITYAQRILRRSQSSAFFKDLPSVFTRGTFTGNNSLDRLLVQFQSFMLNRWSLIEHDMIRQGISTKNIGQAMNMFFWLAMAGFAEMGLRRLSKELIALLTGEDLDDWSETFTKEIVVNTLQNVPVISQGVGLYNYGNIPVPTLSLAQDITEKIQTLKRTKDPNKKMLKALELVVLGIGTATGMPGTMQISEIIRSAGREPKKTQRRGGF